MTLTLERDIHKFRVVQGESIYQATGIAPFSHDLRKGEPGEAREGLLGLPQPGYPHPYSVTPPTPLWRRWQLVQGVEGAVP